MVAENRVNESSATRQLTALVGSDTAAIGVAMLCEEGRDNVDWRVLARREKYPYIVACLVDNEEVRRVPIVLGEDHTVRLLAALPKIRRGRPHEAKIHIVSTPTFRGPNS